MPEDKPQNPNGKTPKLSMPDDLHFERNQVICQRCKRPFEHFLIEEIDNLKQLRCGDVLMLRGELVCLHCGAILNWNVRIKDIEVMAVAYRAILSMYHPE